MRIQKQVSSKLNMCVSMDLLCEEFWIRHMVVRFYVVASVLLARFQGHLYFNVDIVAVKTLSKSTLKCIFSQQWK